MIPESGNRFSAKDRVPKKLVPFPLDGEAAETVFQNDPLVRLPLEHDPEKWIPVFRKDHAPSKC
jgi:hypothetical protein